MSIWKARLKNGKEVSELDSKWEDIKDNVTELLMITDDNKVIQLPKRMESYVQYKTASALLGTNNIEIESRVIGYKLGNIIVRIRVDEKTNNISVEL